VQARDDFNRRIEEASRRIADVAWEV